MPLFLSRSGTIIQRNEKTQMLSFTAYGEYSHKTDLDHQDLEEHSLDEIRTIQPLINSEIVWPGKKIEKFRTEKTRSDSGFCKTK